jgi:hypothetical protein
MSSFISIVICNMKILLNVTLEGESNKWNKNVASINENNLLFHNVFEVPFF